MQEELLGKGCYPDEEIVSGLAYEDTIAGVPQIDWIKGWDIRDVLGGDIPYKNQYQSLSCVGQGWSYYVWILQVIEMMKKYGMNLTELRQFHKDEVDQISAKAIYSQVHLFDGGARIRDAADLLVEWGALFERMVPSYKADGTTDEAHMRDRKWVSKEYENLAKILRSKEHRVIQQSNNMDIFAHAMMMNFGVVGGVVGSNGRGWTTQNPQPPQAGDPLWYHCIFYGAFGIDVQGKFIATPNSWGPMTDERWKPGDPPGTGWQKLRPNYFNQLYQFNPWTLIDNPNMLHLIKGDKQPNVYTIDKSGERRYIYDEALFVKGRDKGVWGDWGTIEVKPQAEVEAMPESTPISETMFELL